MKEAIEKAIEGGYIEQTANRKQMLMEPRFRQALGESLGWKRVFTVANLDMESSHYINDGGEYDGFVYSKREYPEWQMEMHTCVDLIAGGKDINIYFEESIEVTTEDIVKKAFDKISPYIRTDSPNNFTTVKEEILTALKLQKETTWKEIGAIEEYVEAYDADGHRYQIPSSKKDEWEAWDEYSSNLEESEDVPDYAERIDGMPIKSFKDQALQVSSLR